jgi:hypothetical protein
VSLAAAALLAAGCGLAGQSPDAGTTPVSAPGPARQQAAQLAATLNSAGSPGALVPAASATTSPGPSPTSTQGPARRCARAARAAHNAAQGGHPRVAHAARARAAHCRARRRHVFRFFLLRGVEGQYTIRARGGGLKTIAFERGVITSVSAGQLTVKASDGTTWTWHRTAATVVRDRRAVQGKGALATGQAVWVGGPVVQGVKDARLVVIRPPG